jgi:hypothetical protein
MLARSMPIANVQSDRHDSSMTPRFAVCRRGQKPLLIMWRSDRRLTGLPEGTHQAKQMKKVASAVPYEAMQWVWISDHWDCHMSGLCCHNRRLRWFEAEYDDDGEYRDNTKYSIYSLSLLEKLRRLWHKKKFEICVGRHWTYPDRNNGVMFQRKKIKWLGAILWAWQYGKLRDAFRVYYHK